MGRKIFVSYKYADSNVEQFSNLYSFSRQPDTVRSYVNLLENYFKEKSDHVYIGENDGEDLSNLKDDTIREKLYDRIYGSTLTIVMISPDMKEDTDQKDQWIPQEISYSLRKQSRKNSCDENITSSTNAMLAVVLPDYDGNYDYFVKQCTDCSKNCINYDLDWLFPIMKENSFNKKILDFTICDEIEEMLYRGEPSYIKYVLWRDFNEDPEEYISIAYDIRDHIADYNIHVQL